MWLTCDKSGAHLTEPHGYFTTTEPSLLFLHSPIILQKSQPKDILHSPSQRVRVSLAPAIPSGPKGLCFCKYNNNTFWFYKKSKGNYKTEKVSLKRPEFAETSIFLSYPEREKSERESCRKEEKERNGDGG